MRGRTRALGILVLLATMPVCVAQLRILSYYDDCGGTTDPMTAVLASGQLPPGSTATQTTVLATFDTEFDTDSSESPVGEKETLFTLPQNFHTSTGFTTYSIHPDEQRFLMARFLEGEVGAGYAFILVQNFFEELKRLVPN